MGTVGVGGRDGHGIRSVFIAGPAPAPAAALAAALGHTAGAGRDRDRVVEVTEGTRVRSEERRGGSHSSLIGTDRGRYVRKADVEGRAGMRTVGVGGRDGHGIRSVFIAGPAPSP